MTSGSVLLIVHGGAGQLAEKKVRYPGRLVYEKPLAAALRAGQRILLRGGSAVRAVTAAVCVLENHELFNAGRGAALCADGSVELSASVMKGRHLASGAMVGLKRTKNPILAAEALTTHRHGLLYGEQGDAFAQSQGLEMVPPDYFRVRDRVRQWRRLKSSTKVRLDHSDDHLPAGTVGAVALDRRGNLAAGTSTGGLVNQLAGRVGDSPVVGAGTWADNRVCAISATGEGDAFARLAFARRVADLIELAGKTPEAAARDGLDEIKALKANGGCIIVDRQGRFALPFNSRHMLRGWVAGDGTPMVAIVPDEEVPVST